MIYLLKMVIFNSHWAMFNKDMDFAMIFRPLLQQAQANSPRFARFLGLLNLRMTAAAGTIQLDVFTFEVCPRNLWYSQF